MSGAALKKNEGPSRLDQIHIQVGRDVVINASRLTSETITQKSDEILRETLKELEKKQHKT
jgi:hypothetical protein